MKQYKDSLENMGDFNNIIHTAVEEAEMRGHAAGLEQGLERGREEGKLVGERNKAKEIAANLLSAGMAIDAVADVTGLSAEELRQL